MPDIYPYVCLNQNKPSKPIKSHSTWKNYPHPPTSKIPDIQKLGPKHRNKIKPKSRGWKPLPKPLTRAKHTDGWTYGQTNNGSFCHVAPHELSISRNILPCSKNRIWLSACVTNHHHLDIGLRRAVVQVSPHRISPSLLCCSGKANSLHFESQTLMISKDMWSWIDII